MRGARLLFATLTLQVLLAYYFCRAQKAVQLLEYDIKDAKKFVLNPKGLELIRSLSQPLQVISAVGDARVGKSTAMNIVHHVWSKRSAHEFTEVFETGGSVVAVTRGVWISVLRGNDGMERVILDVEGTDLGDDAVTDHLSIFTALMSSGMTFFMQNAVKTHSIDFLFRVTRLSEVIFKDHETIKNFPWLGVILRGALESSPGTQLEDYVRDALVVPNGKDGSDEKRRAIGKHFPRDHIHVSTVQDLQADRHVFKDFDRLSRSEYMKSLEVLAGNLKQFPVKRTLKGGLMDGRTLAELAVKLVETMANDTWHDFANVYLMVEKHLCDRRYKDIVEPQIGRSAQAISSFLATGFSRFDKECALPDYVAATKAELTRIANTKAELEQKQRKLNIEIEKRKAEENKRVKAEAEFNQDKIRMNIDLAAEKANSAKVVEEASRLIEQTRAMQSEIALLQSQVQESEERLRRIQDSDGGFFGFIKELVDTVVKLAIPIKILGN